MKKVSICSSCLVAVVIIIGIMLNGWKSTNTTVFATLALEIICIVAILYTIIQRYCRKSNVAGEIKFAKTTIATSASFTDEWLSLADGLSAKLDWAQSIDINKIAQEANSTPEMVVKVSYPDLWLEFGALVQTTEKVSLQKAVTLGNKIFSVAGAQSELWAWFHAYMNSSDGWGSIIPKDYVYQLNKQEMNVLNRIVNVGEKIRYNLRSLTTLSEYMGVVKSIPEGYWLEGSSSGQRYRHDLASQFDQRKDELINEGRNSCKTLEDLIDFYYSFPSCPKGAYILCTCSARTKIASEIYKIIEKALEDAKTVSEVEAIEIPHGLDGSEPGDCKNTTWLWKTRESVLKNLQEAAIEEEEQRIRFLIK